MLATPGGHLNNTEMYRHTSTADQPINIQAVFVSDIAIFVLKRDVKLQLNN